MEPTYLESLPRDLQNELEKYQIMADENSRKALMDIVNYYLSFIGAGGVYYSQVDSKWEIIRPLNLIFEKHKLKSKIIFNDRNQSFDFILDNTDILSYTFFSDLIIVIIQKLVSFKTQYLFEFISICNYTFRKYEVKIRVTEDKMNNKTTYEVVEINRVLNNISVP